jgi:hypothetical protein
VSGAARRSRRAFRGRLSLFADGMYLGLEAERQTQADGEGNVTIPAAIIELGAAYAVVQAPLVEGKEQHFTL